jgi:hypothetical protein
MLSIWGSIQKYKRCDRMLSHYIWRKKSSFIFVSHYFYTSRAGLTHLRSYDTGKRHLVHPHMRRETAQCLEAPKNASEWEENRTFHLQSSSGNSYDYGLMSSPANRWLILWRGWESASDVMSQMTGRKLTSRANESMEGLTRHRRGKR